MNWVLKTQLTFTSTLTSPSPCHKASTWSSPQAFSWQAGWHTSHWHVTLSYAAGQEISCYYKTRRFISNKTYPWQ
jgi:hypothetical protein